MAFYIRKPTIIETEQFHEKGPYPKGVCLRTCLDGDLIKPHVHTIHQNQVVILKDGDWVIPEPDGEHYYPCDAKVFVNTYQEYKCKK